jgi:DNA repair protein RadD
MFRPYQQKAIDATFDYLKGGGKHPLLALPTAAGKTYVIGGIIDRALREGYEHILILSHVKEIIKQDKEGVEKVVNRDVAIYSAGFEVKQINKLTVAGIQSAYRKPELFAHFDMIIIDECHLISPNSESMYQQFLAGMTDIPRIGLTATPFRLKEGYIYGPDKMFDGIAYDLTSMEKFNQLIRDGYLSNLTTKATGTKLITEGVKITAGDFNEKALAEANNRMEITTACIDEIIAKGADRKKWLAFAIDIAHAESIAEVFCSKGVKAAVLHSKMEEDRDQVIRRFKDGEFRCLVNVNILTTGFNVPDIDLVALLRPTQSPVLHVQTIGRGMRVAPGKHDCLILDFAGNISRLGPINDVRVTRKRKGKGGGAMVKECPQCSELVHLRVEICPACGHKFEFKQKLSARAALVSPIASRNSKQWFDVSDVKYTKHEKYGAPPSLKVTYITASGEPIREWVCIEHSGFARRKATAWMMARRFWANTVDEAIVAKSCFLTPSKILVDLTGKYPVVEEAIFPREKKIAYN